MATYAYLRVSTDQQADSGAGLDAQLDACTKAAGTLAGVYRDESISGAAGLEKRPALLEAIATLKREDVLMVAKRDRLGRDPLVVAMIESAVTRKGARIQSAAGEGTEGNAPGDILMRRMVDAFAEYERLIIGARTKSALQAKRVRGERVGHIPFGKRLAADAVHLEDEPTEQATIRQIATLKASGLSLRRIAHDLNRQGSLKRDGSPWNHVNLHTLCTRDGAA
jgi:DNA invertase Pin-like site-specific DNA recombinase